MKKLVALLIVSLVFATAPAFSADYQKGVDAANKGDYKTALREWLPFAEQGNAVAQYNLGLLYQKGWGVPQDYKQALKWYHLSAEQGHVDAQYNLGSMYSDGQGVPQDYKQGVKWFILSAEQGDADAQYNLGAMYNNGDGVIQDYVRAHMWYNISASNGIETASEKRDNTTKKMTPSQLEKAQDLARACVAKDYKGC